MKLYIYSLLLLLQIVVGIHLHLNSQPFLTPLCLLKPFLGSSDSVNLISGKIKLGKEVLATLEGHWVGLYCAYTDLSPTQTHCVWYGKCGPWFRNKVERRNMVILCGRLGFLSQDSEIFINDKKTGTVDTFWNPTPELRQSRLTRCTVPPEEQGEFESERWAFFKKFFLWSDTILLVIILTVSPSDCGSTWPGPSTTRTRPRPPMRSSSWRKLRGSLRGRGRPNVRSGSLPCLSKTRSLGSGITDMLSEWRTYLNLTWIYIKQMWCAWKKILWFISQPAVVAEKRWRRLVLI